MQSKHRVRSGRLLNFNVGWIHVLTRCHIWKSGHYLGKGATRIGMRAFGRLQMILSTLKLHCTSLTKRSSPLPLSKDAHVALLEDHIVTSSETVIAYRNSSSPALHLWSFIPCRLVTSSRSSMSLGANLKSQTWKEKIHMPKELQNFAKINIGKSLDNILGILLET